MGNLCTREGLLNLTATSAFLTFAHYRRVKHHDIELHLKQWLALLLSCSKSAFLRHDNSIGNNNDKSRSIRARHQDSTFPTTRDSIPQHTYTPINSRRYRQDAPLPAGAPRVLCHGLALRSCLCRCRRYGILITGRIGFLRLPRVPVVCREIKELLESR